MDRVKRDDPEPNDGQCSLEGVTEKAGKNTEEYLKEGYKEKPVNIFVEEKKRHKKEPVNNFKYESLKKKKKKKHPLNLILGGQ